MRVVGTSPNVKQCNVNLVKWFLLERGGATKPEIAQHTGISLMTVGKIVNEMVAAGTLRPGGARGSALGRKAELYSINPDCGCAISLRFVVEGIFLVVSDELGGIRAEEFHPLPVGYGFAEVRRVVEAAMPGLPPVKSVVAGFPASVANGKLHSGHLEQFRDVDVQRKLDQLFGMPVLIGRDLNICTLGYMYRGVPPFTPSRPEIQDLVYFYFSRAGYGAGILSAGRVLKGFANFAGEVGRMPLPENRYIREVFESGADDEEYLCNLVQMIGAVVCLVNPAVAVFSGDSVRPHLMEELRRRLESQVHFLWAGQGSVCPKLIYEEDIWPSYRSGLVYVATRRMHAGVCIVEDRGL